MGSSGEGGGKVVAYIGSVSDPDTALCCDECGQEADEALLCLCGKGLCSACLVIGVFVDTCQGCADQMALELAATGPSLTLLPGGRSC